MSFMWLVTLHQMWFGAAPDLVQERERGGL